MPDYNSHVISGSNSGLYNFNRLLGTIVQIKGIQGISAFGIQRNCPKTVMISNHDNKMHQCDLQQLENCSLTAYTEPHVEFICLDYSLIDNSERWHYCNVNFDGSNITAIAAQASQILIMKFDASSNIFKPVRTMDTAEPVISIHFTKHSVIVASNKFFEIDLITYAAEEFLDMSDVSLRDTVNLKPLFITQISSKEFLLCFKEIGIFVDEFGNRSRPIIEDIKWLYKPREFMYKDSVLFVSHAECLEIIDIEKSFTRELIQHHSKTPYIENNGKSRVLLNLQDHKIVHSDSLRKGIFVSIRNITDAQNISCDIYFFESIKVLKSAVKDNYF
jgi:citron Rho-interacting kinase